MFFETKKSLQKFTENFQNGIIIKPLTKNLDYNEKMEVKMDNLTKREKTVLELLTQGYSNTEIAMVLGISTHTAKAHVQHILTKFKVQNRTRLAFVCGQNKKD
jgi:DNA-binding NarL/FixJ family response regulator